MVLKHKERVKMGIQKKIKKKNKVKKLLFQVLPCLKHEKRRKEKSCHQLFIWISQADEMDDGGGVFSLDGNTISFFFNYYLL